MNRGDFAFLAGLVKERSGLALASDKAYLLESRLLPVARKWGRSSLAGLVTVLRGRPEAALLRDVVEAMATNESFFFRDLVPFEQFQSYVLPHLLEARAATRSLRIWSAACSSGQEPYSIAMILAEEQAKLAGWRVEILATDLSTGMLEKARLGLYTPFEVQRGLPVPLLVKYFRQDGERWRIEDALRSRIEFRYFNLLADPSGLGRFDVVFCRNVLIYFDQPTKAVVLDRISRQLAPDGYLYLGGAETTLGVTDKLQPVPDNRGIYRLAPPPPLARAAAS